MCKMLFGNVCASGRNKSDIAAGPGGGMDRYPPFGKEQKGE